MFRPSTLRSTELSTEFEQRAVARRDASTRGAELAVKLAIVGGVGALLLALGFTALTVRSITVPLKQLERSMASITQGDLDPAMPRTGAHEIGAMITTLGMLRDSLIERGDSSANASEPRRRSAPRATPPRRRCTS